MRFRDCATVCHGGMVQVTGKTLKVSCLACFQSDPLEQTAVVARVKRKTSPAPDAV